MHQIPVIQQNLPQIDAEGSIEFPFPFPLVSGYSISSVILHIELRKKT